ncbi:uncharacterized protein LOC132638573 [Lycium barbarum]|uniref:uncharacterized protein LOC132603467 n=1 Tax=Lycium barbarum TaxID=112863 RepID=UPI00293E9A1B|nr:uncharacterized protein LOC132603467 [Lycium barbarum]XP_060211392.1 uncharacterized protein LOC132638573 [Lycium barbarum]
MVSVMPPKKKATMAEKAKRVAASRVERELEEEESHNAAPPQTAPIPPAPAEQGRAPAPVPPPAAPGQQMAEAIQLLTQLVAAQAQRQDVDPGDRAVSARARDFITLRPPEFYGSKPEEDPQNFIDEMLRTLRIIHASDTESVELASYRLRDVAVLWYSSWISSRGANAPPPVWQEFTEAFLRHFLPPEVRRARADMFLNLRQGNMSVREYSLRFNSLARYAPAMIADRGDHVHRFVSGLGPHLVKECLTASLQDGMTITRIQAHAQNLEEQYQPRREERYPDRGSRKRGRFSRTRSEYRGGQTQGQFGYSDQPVASAPPRVADRGFDRPADSGAGQSTRAPGYQYRDDSSRMMPPPPRCTRCGRPHSGQCYRDTGACYACGRADHLMRDCPLRNEGGRTQPAGSAIGSSSTVRPRGQISQAPTGRGRGRGGAPSLAGPPHRIYALTGRQDPEPPADAATGQQTGGRDL